MRFYEGKLRGSAADHTTAQIQSREQGFISAKHSWKILFSNNAIDYCLMNCKSAFFFFFYYKIWKCIWFNPMLLCTHFNRFPFTCFSVKYTDLFPYLNIMQNSHPGAGMCSLHYCCAFRLGVGTPSFSVADDMIMYLKVSSSFKGKLYLSS